MPRKPIPDEVVTSILLSSRRRCCLCFGLSRDLSLKAGQIAHLDQNNQNDKEDNLVFLCLQHHDEFDSRTSQRKGLTKGEVKAYRTELYEQLSQALTMPVHFGEITLPKADPYAGAWIRVGDEEVESAEVTLTPIADSFGGSARYAVTGFALWGTHREHGPNIGDFAFVGDMKDDCIEHHETRSWDQETYSIMLRFADGKLEIDETNWLGRYGMNVHFMGAYRRPG